MTYLEKHKTSGFRNFMIAGLVIVFFVIALVQIFSPHIFPAFWNSIASPFWRAEFSVTNGSLSSPESLLRENEYLKQELAADLARMNNLEYIEFENAELRALMGNASSTTTYTLAAVLMRPPLSPYDELIIDGGHDRGFSASSTAYASGNIPIGRVTEVFGQTSRVVLYSSPGQKRDVLIGPNHLPTTAIGRGGGQYEAEIPKGLNVAPGDFVILATQDTRPLGEVASVNNETAAPFQKIFFSWLMPRKSKDIYLCTKLSISFYMKLI
jgi:cell shape-determining protein MreC